MKRLVLVFAATLVGAATGAMLAGPLAAQPDGRYERGDGYGDRYGDGFIQGSNFPGGSWRESCRAPSWRGRILFAQCRTTYDRWVGTRIDPGACPGGRLINSDGRLTCEGSGGGWGQGSGWQLPGGSWRQSCRYPVMRGRLLSAQCQTEYSRWMSSTIDPNRCPSGRISNENGRLACDGGIGGNFGDGFGGGFGDGSGWGGGGYPGGSWRQSCRNSSIQGSVLYAQCNNSSGYSNDSSIDARGCRSNRVGNDNGRLVCEY